MIWKKYEIGNKTSPQQQMFFSHKTTLDSPKDLIHVVEIIENIWLATKKITRITIINITIQPYNNSRLELISSSYRSIIKFQLTICIRRRRKISIQFFLLNIAFCWPRFMPNEAFFRNTQLGYLFIPGHVK